ncbi:hypothetical protein [Montanilutibacter psychrotolerans]|uniref:hypothetical protein n=1 Tax=Montanilutibacter psychrotolerans TaxID=1327343 RepID=UPI001CC20CDA|nr:hypothetical protein [Lysobacter psychrotolerans]
MSNRLPVIALLLATALLAGCDDKQRTTSGGPTAQGGDDSPLPVPTSKGGSITGMPDSPGPGTVGPPVADVPAEPLLDADGNPLLPADASLTDPATDGVGPTDIPGEPTAQEALTVVRDYYAAINGGRFANAYALWSDGGRATGQTPQEFADGFGDTAGVSLEILPPGRIDAGAGSRHIEVPVALDARQRDGTVRRYSGSFTLRRSVVDGASPEQRAWRIATADLREAPP